MDVVFKKKARGARDVRKRPADADADADADEENDDAEMSDVGSISD